MNINRTNAEIVLSALLAGHRVEIGEYIYLLSRDGFLCTVCYDINGDESDKILRTFMSFSQFVALADSATEYEIMVVCANVALNQSKQRDRD